MELTFYETTSFTEGVSKLRAEAQCLELKHELTRNPEKGDLLRGTGGFVRQECVCRVEVKVVVLE